MPSVGSAFLEVKPDLDGFHNRMRAGIRGSSSKLKSVGRIAGGALAAGIGAAVVGTAIVGKFAIEAAQEAAEVGAQTEAVLKSTKGAANVTREEFDALTTTIMNYSAIEDEVIAQGANMLLTFTNIRNEVGKGNDIFDQATETITDMSVALGQDMKGSAIQLGKALNDPIGGITALRRVGVQFTRAQEDQIRALVESGRTMDAQKLILQELRREFGGSARAAGNVQPYEKLKNAIGEVMEGIGGALLPTVNRLARRLQRFVQSSEFQAWLEEAEGWLKTNLPNAIEDFTKAFKDAWPTIKQTGENIIGIFRVIAGVIDAAITDIQLLAEMAGRTVFKQGGEAKGSGLLGPQWPGRQAGGSVAAGGAFLVGERGPELLQMGNRSGNIIPNHKLGGEPMRLVGVLDTPFGPAQMEAIAVDAADGVVDDALRGLFQGGI